MENPVLNILSKVDANTLPVVPRVLLDLIHATHKTDVSFKELSKIIGQDASLSSKVLATANSSYYRQWGEINDLNRVITVLGLNTIKTIAITRTVQQFFSQIPPLHYDVLEIVWYRSLSCAYLAHALARLTSYPYPDEAYLTGLIHRLGQLVLLKCFPKEYPYFLAEHLDNQQQALERQTFGATHVELGSYLISTWKIEPSIAEAVLCQAHTTEALVDRPALVKIINLACKLSALGSEKKRAYFLADRYFGLSENLLDNLLDEVSALVEQSASSLGIVVSNAGGTSIKSQTPETKRHEVQNGVAEYIKQMALNSVLKQQCEPSEEISQFLSYLHRDVNVLFGLRVSAIYVFKPELNSLVNGLESQDSTAHWPSISVGFKPDQSLIAKAWANQEIYHTFETNKTDPISIADRQIAQLHDSEGMLLIPLWTDMKSVGVVVVPIDRAELTSVEAIVDFITLFAKQAGFLLQKLTNPAEPNEKSVNYPMQVRKLVHEANNPLGVINNYLYLLRQKLGEEQSDEIRIIQEEIDRVSDILLRLPDASSSNESDDRKPVDVNRVITDLIQLFQPGLFETHQLQTVLKLDPSLPNIVANRCKIKQILTNLIKNSAEAMAIGGILTVTTQDRVSHRNRDYVEIQIHDTGPGIAKELLPQLFNPMTSAKGNGHSGLGLTICKNLADEMKGVIECTQSSEQGSTFRLLLPRNT